MKKRICGSAPCECVQILNKEEEKIMYKHEPSTIKLRRCWSGLKAGGSIMAAFRERNARLQQPHNPRERICAQRLKLGFTLAEILITLSIIGVVAALTIPTLIQRTGDEEIVSKLSKAYSTLSQATEMIMTEQGNPKVWNTNADSLYNAYKSHLRNAKECGSAGGCFSQINEDTRYKLLNGGLSDNWDTNSNKRNLILSDGTQISFMTFSTQCNSTDIYGYGTNNVCAVMHVDVNGKKAPNAAGRDVFLFMLKETGLYPAGCEAANIDDVCSKNNAGWGCACRVLQEGKIDY